MKGKRLKKIIIVAFVLSIFTFFAIPKAFAVNDSNTNQRININYNSVDDEYDSGQERGVQPRHVSNNSSGKQDTQATTWIGVILLSVIILVALKTLPNEIEKRL